MRTILMLIMTALAACQSLPDPEEIRSGGPCTYNEFPFTFTVVEVKKMPPQSKTDTVEHFDILAVMNADSSGASYTGSRAGDTLYYHGNRGKYATKEYIINRNVKPGRVFTGIKQEIKTGSCNPNVTIYYWED